MNYNRTPFVYLHQIQKKMSCMACGRACKRACVGCGGKYKFCSAECQAAIDADHKFLCYNIHDTSFDAEQLATHLHDVWLDMTDPENYHIQGLYTPEDMDHVQTLCGLLNGDSEDVAVAVQHGHDWISEVTLANSLGPALVSENFNLYDLNLMIQDQLNKDHAYAQKLAQDPEISNKEVDAFYAHLDRCDDTLQNLLDTYHGENLKSVAFTDMDSLHRAQVEQLLSASVARGTRRRLRRRRRTKRLKNRKKKARRRDKEGKQARREEGRFQKKQSREARRAVDKEKRARGADKKAAGAKSERQRQRQENRAARLRRQRDEAKVRGGKAARKKEERGRRAARKEEGAARARRKAGVDKAKLERMDRKKAQRRAERENQDRIDRGEAPPLPPRRYLSDPIRTKAGILRYRPVTNEYVRIYDEHSPRSAYDMNEYEHEVDPDILHEALLLEAAANPNNADVMYFLQTEAVGSPEWCKDTAEYLMVGNALYRTRLYARLLVPGGRKKILKKIQSGSYKDKKKGKSKLEDIKAVAERLEKRSVIKSRKAQWQELAEAAEEALQEM